MERQRRIGIYGGTFDPVHSGHIEIARRVSQLFEIEEVVFVPALLAPHKLERRVTSHLHRYAMLVLATESDGGMKVSTFELEASDRRYTVDTVTHFQAQYAGTAELFFIMGADSWSEINAWKDWERLLTQVNHIVVTRPGFDVRKDHIPSAMHERIVDMRGAAKDREQKVIGGGGIFVTDAVMNDVSASAIRRAVTENRLAELDRWVPGPVAQYVKKYGLYRDSNEA